MRLCGAYGWVAGLALALAVALGAAGAAAVAVGAAGPAACAPSLADEVPARVRRVCAALNTIYELSSAMESYLDDKGPGPAQVYNQMVRPESAILGQDVKRQDVDHVFLRFGRRR